MSPAVVLRDRADTLVIVLVEPLTEARHNVMASGSRELVLTRCRAEATGSQPPALGETSRVRVLAGTDLIWSKALAGHNAAGISPVTEELPVLELGWRLEEAVMSLARAAQVMLAAMTIQLGREAGETGLMAMKVETVLDALEEQRNQEPVSSPGLPRDISEAGRVHVFRPDDGGAEHYAIEIAVLDLTPHVTVRFHSDCFTGDILGSLKCDCGPKLRGALAAMAEGGSGVLFYLNPDGIGIGRANKMRAYTLQVGALHRVEANHWLGFEDDQRDFGNGAQILRRMGTKQIRLIPNNPANLTMLEKQGLDFVDRVSLKVGRTEQNARYLEVTAANLGHLL